jgi:hypothetical protein
MFRMPRKIIHTSATKRPARTVVRPANDTNGEALAIFE